MNQSLSPVSDKAAWRAKDLRDDTSWLLRLDQAEIVEIRNAVTHFERLGLQLSEINKDNFQLPFLTKTLLAVSDQIEHGRGCVLVRGLPGKEFSVKQMGIIFFGLGKYLGLAITQNAQGDLLGHVRNEGLKYGEKDVRGYQTDAKLRFHCDNCDIVGLMCVRPARKGGG